MATERKIYTNSSTSFDEDESFSRLPLSSYWSKDDFSNRALVKVDGENINLDLMVQRVDMQFAENHQVEEHIGNTFSAWFFGKAPMDVDVTASIPDNDEAYGKEDLVSLYLSTLSLNAVARTGSCPELHVKNFVIYGPWVSMKISESSTSSDILAVIFTIQVLKIIATNTNASKYKTFEYDFIHGDAILKESDKTYSEMRSYEDATEETTTELNTVTKDCNTSLSQQEQYMEKSTGTVSTKTNITSENSGVEVSRTVKENIYGDYLI